MDLIYDKDMVNKFLDTILKPLHSDQVYLATLLCKRNYGLYNAEREELNIDRAIITNAANAYKPISMLAKVYDRYEHMIDGLKLHPNNMALNIDLNPKSMIKAYDKLTKHCSMLYRQAVDNKKILYDFRVLIKKFYTNIHRSTAKQYYKVIELHEYDDNTLDKLINVLKDHIVWVNKIYEGYNIILYNSEKLDELFYEHGLLNNRFIKLLQNAETAVCGTIQGGVKVERYDY